MAQIDPKDPKTWPVNPDSSKGERIKDPPAPDSVQAEAEKWMDILPAPPRPFGDQSDMSIEDWLWGVSKHGPEAIEWAWRPSNWPFGPAARGRLQHIYGTICRRLDEDAKFNRERQARERAENSQRTILELKSAKGRSP